MPNSQQPNIPGAISAMRDSVWVISDEMTKPPTKETIQTIGRNVAHLELMMSKEEITTFGEDLSDVTESITLGKAFIEQHSELLTQE